MNQAFSNLIGVSNTEVLEEIVKEYFRRGFLYKEIIHFLETFHGKPLSIRILHRILQSEGLYRKTHATDCRYVIQFIENEISESGSSTGYRQLHQWCINQGLQVTRKTVPLIMKQLDPEDVVRGQRNQLQRRNFGNTNQVTHNPILKLRHRSIISKKPGFLSEKLKTLTSSNYHRV